LTATAIQNYVDKRLTEYADGRYSEFVDARLHGEPDKEIPGWARDVLRNVRAGIDPDIPKAEVYFYLLANGAYPSDSRRNIGPTAFNELAIALMLDARTEDDGAPVYEDEEDVGSAA